MGETFEIIIMINLDTKTRDANVKIKSKSTLTVVFKFFGSLNSEIIAIDDPLCFKVKSDVVGGIHSGPIITVNDGIHIRISAKPGAKNSAILGNALCLFITFTEFWETFNVFNSLLGCVCLS